ncbi:hypothetical protein ACFLSS_02585 [Bacteroidota bacterium]
MSELKINFPLVDGSSLPLEFNSGHELIELIMGDDIRPPISSMQINMTTDDDKKISIGIPNDDSKDFYLEIE